MKAVVLGMAVAALAGGLAGFGLRSALDAAQDAQGPHPIRARGRLTNPLLECELSRTAVENRALRSFRARVAQYIDVCRETGRAGHVSVYFRELNDGAWFSVNPVESFVPASLLKVPTMMAVLQRTEAEPGLLARKLLFSSSADLNEWESIKPSDEMVKGASYTVDELVRRMIVYSDNNAAALLLGLLRPGELERVYSELGVGFHGVKGDESFISVEDYASFFRILYNGSFLDRALSEKALQMLAGVEYSRGLRAGVPLEIPIAHKFGEWTLREQEPFREQLHDCGIVYHPARPYLLCVMTRGNDFEALPGVIAEISHLVYEELEAQSRLDPGP